MKELHTGSYYWNTLHDKQISFPKLEQSLSKKVLIVGGGMSGLLTAYILHKHGIEFVLLEADTIAEGSSLASTGLLQYCNDIMLSDLRSAIGREKADTFYRYCYLAMEQLKQLSQTLLTNVGDTHFRNRSSLQFNSTPQDIVKLQQEYNALSQIGLPCELWGRSQIEQNFPFSKEIGLVTHGDAEVNPYLCVSSIAQYLCKHGCDIYEGTKVIDHNEISKHHYSITVEGGHTVEASYIVYAVGYQPKQLHQKLFHPVINRSYVIVTNQLPEQALWYNKFMLWETARPYLYVRTTVDSRIIVGGLDEKLQAPNKDAQASRIRYNQLLRELKELLHNDHMHIDYEWNATFAESADQLPYLGVDPKDSHIMYVLGYGGNGTVFSMLGAQLLVNFIEQTGEMLDLAEIVKLDR